MYGTNQHKNGKFLEQISIRPMSQRLIIFLEIITLVDINWKSDTKTFMKRKIQCNCIFLLIYAHAQKNSRTKICKIIFNTKRFNYFIILLQPNIKKSSAFIKIIEYLKPKIKYINSLKLCQAKPYNKL
ncbi:unnamed protein product [Paramecium sonneborni]|uniref:Uncharacterized protein n=1 Tax=Paramecium sonneborni TaxID=65129 RepID=A0A8S1RBQ6_9CILI|nr:unnamed protein product [Paramecium sonneborni]